MIRLLQTRSLRSPVLRLAVRRASGAAADKPFDKILIANRGEIACRVINTARRLGIKTVAVYSDADRFSKHVGMADEAVRIGPAPSSQSYLVIDNILKAIDETGAQAVHPGYGFLSENATFSQKLKERNVAFCGPDAHAIREMGDKIGSKKLAQSAGVNVIPGFMGEVKSDEEVLKVAHEIGYPVMVKASAGGGGKGMRVAWNDKEVLEGFRLSKQEAASSFGDDRMLIEKFIDQPRHIEIQVICDGQGTSIYLPERDCSIQRRNQKVLEEAPSTFLDEETRRAMGEQAVALANAVQYRSAGTVEFICDAQRNFYFLEMNTRLQVEHPITEMITGVDLVEHMIEVAAGRRLRLKQEDIKINGHAFESRVYAEDPLRGYLPTIGRLKRYIEPRQENLPPELAENAIVRTDSGILEGSEVSIYYDPMICKLVTHAPTRDHALDVMAWSLDNYVINGVTNNINLLRDLTAHPKFREGDVTTNFLPEQYPDGYQGHELSDQEKRELLGVAAVLQLRQDLRARTVMDDDDEATSENDLNGTQYTVTVVDPNRDGNSTSQSVRVYLGEGDDESAEFLLDFGTERMVIASDSPLSAPIFQASILSSADASESDEPLAELRSVQVVEPLDEGFRLQFLGTRFDVTVREQRAQELAAHMPVKVKADLSNMLLCPMPGTVLSFDVKVGDEVAPGATLCVVEAMKMQNALRSETGGKVKKLLVEPGATVAVDEPLIEFES